MANFAGYLLGYRKNGVLTRFPSQYIALDSWSSTPNQREELEAYRDDNSRALHRKTAAGRKSIFSFTTRPNLHLADKKAIQQFFNNCTENQAERKVSLEFWNEEDNNYKSGSFYLPNMEFKIIKITDDDIIYNALTFEFVEY